MRFFCYNVVDCTATPMICVCQAIENSIAKQLNCLVSNDFDFLVLLFFIGDHLLEAVVMVD